MFPRDIALSFTGHRTYRDRAATALEEVVERFYARGFRIFLNGMAVGFDLAAAEAVLHCRARRPDIRLVAVIPFEGQETTFSEEDRRRYRQVRAAADEVVVLAPAYRRGCYAVRNDFLVDCAGAVVAWYDGSPGGTRYTWRRALRCGLEAANLCPTPVADGVGEPTLF